MFPLCIFDGRSADVLSVRLYLRAAEIFSRDVHFSGRGAGSCIVELQALCDDHAVSLNDLRACVVVGSSERFTIARLMQVLPNAFAYALAIPILTCEEIPTPEQLEKYIAESSHAHIPARYSAQPTMN